MTYLNQTGRIAAVERAAQAVLAEIEAGRIRPEGLLNPAWLTAYRALRENEVDTARLDATLDSFSLNMRAAGDTSIRAVLDRIIAVEAFTPYLTGKAADLPAMPGDISVAFQAKWPLWAELAGHLKTVPLAAFARDEGKAAIVAELLFAAGDPARLADFIASVQPAETKLALATDFAMRLDRTCASVLHHPAEAVLLSGQPIFRFAPAK